MTDPDALRRAWVADSWPQPDRDAPQVLVWRFRFNGFELEGWRPHRVQYTTLDEKTAAILSAWVPSRSPTGALLVVDVFVTPSAADAREFLLRLLGEFQGPGPRRDSGVGEIAFAVGQILVLFLRANVVVKVRSAERVDVAVAGLARQLDALIAAVPDANSPVAATTRLRVSRDAVRGIRIAELDAPATGGPWYKIVVPEGNALAEPGGIVIPSTTAAEITVFVVDQAGNTSRAVLKLP